MNQGHCTLALACFNSAVPSASGTIHKARASFTVVPTCNAIAPYLAAAPTTELVSWIASAAHSPNCVWVSLSADPMAGNVSRATELSTNTVPSDTAISSSVAPVIGPTAAMALPPQIAVPVEIRYAGSFSTRIALPSNTPTTMANEMLNNVYRNPLRPARITSCKFIPKPRPTTEACSRIFDRAADCFAYGWVKIRPKARPMASATGGDTYPLAAHTSPARKRIFEVIKGS